jgi:uncharacterized protein
MHYSLVLELKKLLSHLDTWLAKATEHAAAKKFDPNVLLQARLAPDMFPLIRQIQSSCDSAKFTAARVGGKDAPSHPDDETTMEQARARIASTIAWLDTFTAEDFAAAGERVVTVARWEGKSMTATDYLVEYGVPNTLFHVTTAYAILRHNGVEIGKRDYLGHLTMR